MFAFESDTFDSDTLGSSPMCGLLLVSVQTIWDCSIVRVNQEVPQ